MNQGTRRLITMHKVLHPRDDIDRLCAKKRRERGLASIGDNVDTSIQWLQDCMQKSRGILMTASRNNTNDTRTSGTAITRKQNSLENQLNGRFKRLTSDISHEKMWTWLWKGNLMRESESLQIAAQNNAKRTNHI